MNKTALFVFNGDPLCFIHVLLNALDMHDKNGFEIKVVIEGAAVKLLPELAKEKSPLHRLWKQAVEKGLIHGVCKACSNKMGTLDDAVKQNLALLDDMSGHPSVSGYKKQGYEIIVF